MKFSEAVSAIAASVLLLSSSTVAQTFSSCNPLVTNNCPANPALGKAINIDFTKGAVDSFTASGNPTYSSSGVSFTVAKSGDSPTLSSLFYIMFGKVSITMKAAPGAGIVSTLVLESDDLDEIDLEWLGADDTQVQTNYFGKGDVTTYNRGAFNPAPNNQARFVTYTIEWTAQQIIWSVGGNVVRVLTPATADANQYPQTPMRVKFGSWSGGDPSNAPGTIGWAHGPTNYANGPYTMVVQSLAVSDYSTGTSYTYNGNSGSWESIVANGGKVNGNAGSGASAVATANTPAITSASPSVPPGFGGSSTKTGWPWQPSPTTLIPIPSPTTIVGLPSGWTVSTSGKIVPASTAAQTSYPTSSSSVAPSPSPSSPPSVGPGLETITGWDDRGFPTVYTRPSGWQTLPKSYDQQGFLITSAPSPTTAAVPANGAANQPIVNGAVTQQRSTVNTPSSAAVREHVSLRFWYALGMLAGLRALL